MFKELKKNLSALFQKSGLECSTSYIANGHVFLLVEDPEHDKLTIKFSLFSTPDSSLLLNDVKNCINNLGFSFEVTNPEPKYNNNTAVIVYGKR